jgi:adenosylcobinamide-phosphate synthase
MTVVYALALGYGLDLLIGDPVWLPHPIRLIGWMIARGETLLRRVLRRNDFLAGMLLTVGVVGLTWSLASGLLTLARWVSPQLEFGLQVLFCYQILAARCLRDESMRIHQPLKAGDVIEARRRLSYIVGRDTHTLDSQQITRATVETVAENTSDGVVAPLLFMLVGGAPLGFAYKAINTLDSMIGYKNDRYLYFGRFAAKLDDAANWVPARLTGLLMIAASPLCGLDAANALRIFRRDRRKHSSPNSAQPESAAAGALNVQLAGDASYFGQLVKKPTIGDPNRPIEAEDIRRINRLMLVTSLMALLLLAGWRILLLEVIQR